MSYTEVKTETNTTIVENITAKRKILLAYPKLPETTYWSFTEALKYVGKKVAMPPIGLLTVAAMLPDSFELRLVDMNVDELKDEDILWADIVFTSAMIVQKNTLEEVIKRCNQLEVPVVAGGPYPSSYYSDMEGDVIYVMGEAENVLDDFLADYVSGDLKRVYSKPTRESEYNELISYFGTDEAIELVKDRPEIKGSPVPRFDLLKRQSYGSMAVQFSRGCPIGCEFCDIWRRFGRKMRLKGVEKLLAEFDELYRLGWRGALFVVDDNFIGNKRRIMETLPEIVKWQKAHGFPFSLYTEGTINLADDDELLKLLVDAGFYMVFVGIETPVEESLRETGKFVNTNKKMTLIDRVRKIQQAGIEVSSGFIIGFDNDPENIADLQINFIQDSGIPLSMVGMLSALRDTDLYERLEREGRILGQSDGNNTHLAESNFVTKNDIHKLTEDYKRLLKTIYDPNLKNYLARCTIMLDNLGNNPNYGRNLQTEDIMAFAKSLLTTVSKRYGYQYTKFLTRTLIRTPQHFATGVRLAIMGFHFRAITKSALEADNIKNYFADTLAYFKERFTSIDMGELYARKAAVIAEAQRKMSKLSGEFREILEGHYAEFTVKLEVLFNLRSYFTDKLNIVKEKISQIEVNELNNYKAAILEEAKKKLIKLPREYKQEAVKRYGMKIDFKNLSVEYRELMENYYNDFAAKLEALIAQYQMQPAGA